MSRPKSYSQSEIARLAMEHFWRSGFYGGSVDALVNEIGVSRYSLYAEFGDKEGVFLAALQAYVNEIVNPAFEIVEAADADLSNIAEFFARQIQRAEEIGLPGPGCFLANTMIESKPDDAPFRAAVTKHLSRQRSGFSNALANEALSRAATVSSISEIAEFLTISAQGLWSYSRFATHASSLWAYRDNLIDAVSRRLAS